MEHQVIGWSAQPLQFATRRVVTQGLLSHARAQVVNLLLTVAQGGRTDCSAIKQIGEALELTPALAATLRTCLVVGVDLIRDVEEVLSELLSQSGKLPVSLVAHHVDGLPVDGVISKEEDLVPRGIEGAETTVCIARDGANDDAGRV